MCHGKDTVINFTGEKEIESKGKGERRERERERRRMVPRQTEDPFYNLRFITAYDLTMDTRLASSDKRNGIRIGVFHGTLASHVLDLVNLFAGSFQNMRGIRIISICFTVELIDCFFYEEDIRTIFFFFLYPRSVFIENITVYEFKDL